MHGKLEPPKPDKSDHCYGLFFATLSIIPCIGPPLAEALRRRWPSKYENALTNWRIEKTAQGNHSAITLDNLQNIEHGSNSNGSYRRFGNGTLEVEGSFKGTLGYGKIISVTFPAAFAEPPFVQTFDESHGLKIERVTPHHASFKIMGQAFEETITLRYRALGSWR